MYTGVVSFDNLEFLTSEKLARFREHLRHKFDLQEPFWCDAHRPRRASTGGVSKAELCARDVPLLMRRLHPTLTAAEYALLRTNPLFHAAMFDACEACFLTLTTGSAVAAPPNRPGWVSTVFERSAFLDPSHFEVDTVDGNGGSGGGNTQLSQAAEALLTTVDEGEISDHADGVAGASAARGGERAHRLIIRCKNVPQLACSGALAAKAEAKAEAEAKAKAKVGGASNQLAASAPKSAHAGAGGGGGGGDDAAAAVGNGRSRPPSAMSVGSEDSAAHAALPFAPVRPASVPRLPLSEIAALPGNRTRPKKRSPTKPKEDTPPLRPVQSLRRPSLSFRGRPPARAAPPLQPGWHWTPSPART